MSTIATASTALLNGAATAMPDEGALSAAESDALAGHTLGYRDADIDYVLPRLRRRYEAERSAVHDLHRIDARASFIVGLGIGIAAGAAAVLVPLITTGLL